MFGLPVWARSGTKNGDPKGKLRGALFCLASYAQKINPENPKDLVEAFFESPGISARALTGLGRVSFPIQTANQDVQKWFNQGVACLHLLMDEEAERAFRQVITLDPEAAPGYWGLALANFDQAGRGAFFARLAAGKIRDETSPSARKEIESLARFFSDPSGALPERLQMFASDLESIARDHPDHPEAKALLFRQLVLNEVRGRVPLRRAEAADRLAVEVLAGNPAHPCQHLRRLLWKKHRPTQLTEAGLLDPAGIASAAPALAWRILGEAQQAATQWEASAASLVKAVETARSDREGWFDRPVRSPSFSDDCVALIEALSKLGRPAEALDLAEAMMAQALPGTVASDKTRESFWWSIYAQGAWSYALVCHEHRLMDRLAAKMIEVGALIDGLPSADKLREEVAMWTERNRFGRNHDLSPEAWAHDSLATGSWEGALNSLVSVPESRRSAFLPKALAIIAHYKAGNVLEARSAFDREFRRQAGAATSPLRDHPALREVAALCRIGPAWPLPAGPESTRLTASVHNLSGDLRKSWPVAPEFSLPDGKGTRVDLASFRGKPVVLIFFLGAGCYQCMEQLVKFLPLAEAYRRAGISVVAISPDPVALLEHSIPAARRGSQPIPFAVLSDEKLAVFKDYFVFNEFEARPLHGTVLIDPEGRVRWSHIDNRPFTDPTWLLGEAQRVIP